MTGDRPRPEGDILEYYGRGNERDRLGVGYGLLERDRTRGILSRALPPPPAAVADVGGGAGVHALWLASLGYSVHLRDPVPLHVGQAEDASRAPNLQLASVGVGDARAVDLEADTVDVALLLGPLYHLQEAADRRQALGEARRILRAGGLLAVAAVSRWAPVLDGLKLGLLEDGGHRGVLDAAQKTGRFDPLPQSGFTRAYLHRPEELREEVASAPLRGPRLGGRGGARVSPHGLCREVGGPAQAGGAL